VDLGRDHHIQRSATAGENARAAACVVGDPETPRSVVVPATAARRRSGSVSGEALAAAPAGELGR
jgi:hypothetical protein